MTDKNYISPLCKAKEYFKSNGLKQENALELFHKAWETRKDFFSSPFGISSQHDLLLVMYFHFGVDIDAQI